MSKPKFLRNLFKGKKKKKKERKTTTNRNKTKYILKFFKSCQKFILFTGQ